MSAIQDGKKLFDQLSEYPLPVKQGLRDYVFYFVPAADGFGGRAREFFDKFYPKHKKADVGSLQALIANLHGEVTTQGINQIREVVIVSHGSALGLFFPLLPAVPADKPDYKYLTPRSLALLQKDMLAGNLADFNNQRKVVIGHLLNDSRITIRACNFGRNKEGMYALYAFFGGAPNIYAPTMYQLFSDCPIGQGERFESRALVHEHLVKQRFFPKDIHTPDRKEAVMLALVSAGKSSDAITLATTKINDTTSDAAVQYQALITDLNNRVLGPFIRQQFQAAGFLLTDGASANVINKDSNWVVSDTFVHEAETYQIAYVIYESSTTGGDTLNLSADASLAVNKSDAARQQVVHSTKDHFPLQLFINEEENRAFKGWLFDLAVYLPADPKSADQVSYEAIIALLNAGKLNEGAGGMIDIALLFKNASHELGTNAAITQGLPNKTWLVNDSVSYLVKAELADTETGLAHVLGVYQNLDDRAKKNWQYDQLADPSFGTNSDLPGTELMAWLDTYRLDQLIDLIDFLRSPYDPVNVAYLNHAQEALMRKNGFRDWFQGSDDKEEMEKNPLINGARFQLSLREYEDNRTTFYSFDANTVWNEVKSSNPPAAPFKDDLFLEQPFDFPDLPDVSTLADPDSPFNNMKDLQSLEMQGKERLFSTDKIVIKPPSTLDPGCEKYGELLAKMKAVNSTKMDEVFKAVKNFEVEKDKTFGDLMTEHYGHTPLKLTWELLENFEVYAVEHEAGFASTLARVAESRLLGAIGFGLVMLEPFIMQWEFIETEQKTNKFDELQGKIVGVRQWARELEYQAGRSDFHFPDTIHFDSATQERPGEYFLVHYHWEWQLTFFNGEEKFIFSNDFFKKGFDEGWEAVEEAGNEVLEKVDIILNEMLKDSGLDPCKAQKLKDSGLLDMNEVRKVIMKFFSKKLMERTPRPFRHPPVRNPDEPEGTPGEPKQPAPETIPEK